MSDLGKIDRDFFDEYVYPNLGAERDDVTLGPQHGVDFGVIELGSMSNQNSESSDDAIDLGDRVAAMATDPVFVMPSLGFERAAWFAVHILLSDVAVSGLAPTHLSVDLNMPAEITDEQFATLWETFDREATELGVSIVTGHTGRYAGCNYPMIGGGTSIAVGDAEDLVRPNDARPGDKIVITKGPAIEATGLMSIQFESLMQGELDDGVIEDAKGRFYDMSPIRDALTAAAAGPVSAMHDATEGGVHGGLYEMARASGVGIEIERDRIPVQPGVLEACDFFGIDPWISISEGTLLASVAPAGVDDVLAALESEGIPAAEIGEVTDGSGLTVDGERVDHPGHDPFWGAFEEHMQKLQAED